MTASARRPMVSGGLLATGPKQDYMLRVAPAKTSRKSRVLSGPICPKPQLTCLHEPVVTRGSSRHLSLKLKARHVSRMDRREYFMMSTRMVAKTRVLGLCQQDVL